MDPEHHDADVQTEYEFRAVSGHCNDPSMHGDGGIGGAGVPHPHGPVVAS